MAEPVTAVLLVGVFVALFVAGAAWAAAPLLLPRPGAARGNGAPGSAGVPADGGGPNDVPVGFAIYS